MRTKNTDWGPSSQGPLTIWHRTLFVVIVASLGGMSGCGVDDSAKNETPAPAGAEFEAPPQPTPPTKSLFPTVTSLAASNRGDPQATYAQQLASIEAERAEIVRLVEGRVGEMEALAKAKVRGGNPWAEATSCTYVQTDVSATVLGSSTTSVSHFNCHVVWRSNAEKEYDSDVVVMQNLKKSDSGWEISSASPGY